MTTTLLLLCGIGVSGALQRQGVRRRRHAARSASVHSGLRGRHGGQHADAGGRAGRAAVGDRRARRVHLDRVSRAEDAADRVEASARVGRAGGAPTAAGRGGQPAGREAVARGRCGGRHGRSPGRAGRRPAGRLATERGTARPARRAVRRRWATGGRRRPGTRTGGGGGVDNRSAGRRTDRRRLGPRPPRAGRHEPVVERDQVRDGQADPARGRGAGRPGAHLGRGRRPGIARADQQRIFHAFERLANAQPRRRAGAGALHRPADRRRSRRGAGGRQRAGARGPLHTGAAARATPPRQAGVRGP